MLGAKHIGLLEAQLQLDTRRYEQHLSERFLRYTSALTRCAETVALIDSSISMQPHGATAEQQQMRDVALKSYQVLKEQADKLSAEEAQNS